MKKRGLIIGTFFLALLLMVQIVFAENATENSALEDTDKVALAYQCLESKIDAKGCQSLTLEEKIFSVIATGKCQAEFLDSSKENTCWPKANCNVQDTAKAMIAMKRIGADREKMKEWILTKNKTATGLNWYLQIEGNEKMNCNIKYSGGRESNIEIFEDKTISGGAGNCLTLTSDKYWLAISPSCYRTEFEISCDKSFQTNLLYRKTNSPVVYVSGKTTFGSPSSTNVEKVESECFTKEGECDYLTTLWATFALVAGSSDAYDVSPFWSYLQAMNGENDKILSEGILDYLSKSEVFRTKLMQKQAPDGYWSVSGDNFYDTGFALLPYSGDSIGEKEKTISWLLAPRVQDKDGCWKGNILNTALLLYSIWPKQIVQVPTSSQKPSCEGVGNFCLSPIDCTENAGGTILNEYTCTVASKSCCSKNVVLSSCSEKGGSVCNSNEDCFGGTLTTASGLMSGETCCIGGSCKEKVVESECEREGGSCFGQAYGCGRNEEESDYSCSDAGKVCCVTKSESEPKERSGLWIWIIILIILIIIVALLIIFRDRLRPYWLKVKSKFDKKKGSGDGRPGQPNFRGPGMPPGPSSSIPQRGLPVRRIPPQQAQPRVGQNQPSGFPNQPQRVPMQQQRPVPQNFPPQRNPNVPPRDNRTNEAIDKLKEMNR